MRIIIGVLLGLFIIFNWADIREYMDSKISSVNSSNIDQSNDESESYDDEADSASEGENSSNNDEKNNKDDGWGDFR